jgi:hypothetical protein
MQIKKSFSALLLCFLLSAATLFSLFYIASETNHDCPGEQCPICRVIAICRFFLNVLALGTAVHAFRIIITHLHRIVTIRIQKTYYSSKNPVSLKIKLSN